MTFTYYVLDCDIDGGLAASAVDLQETEGTLRTRVRVCDRDIVDLGISFKISRIILITFIFGVETTTKSP